MKWFIFISKYFPFEFYIPSKMSSRAPSWRARRSLSLHFDDEVSLMHRPPFTSRKIQWCHREFNPRPSSLYRSDVINYGTTSSVGCGVLYIIVCKQDTCTVLTVTSSLEDNTAAPLGVVYRTKLFVSRIRVRNWPLPVLLWTTQNKSTIVIKVTETGINRIAETSDVGYEVVYAVRTEDRWVTHCRVMKTSSCGHHLT